MVNLIIATVHNIMWQICGKYIVIIAIKIYKTYTLIHMIMVNNIM